VEAAGRLPSPHHRPHRSSRNGCGPDVWPCRSGGWYNQPPFHLNPLAYSTLTRRNLVTGKKTTRGRKTSARRPLSPDELADLRGWVMDMWEWSQTIHEAVLELRERVKNLERHQGGDPDARVGSRRTQATRQVRPRL
jgi:hypothetical protein